MSMPYEVPPVCTVAMLHLLEQPHLRFDLAALAWIVALVVCSRSP